MNHGVSMPLRLKATPWESRKSALRKSHHSELVEMLSLSRMPLFNNC
jgi:hypothetical protein